MQRVTMNFDATPISDVADMLRDQTGLNILLDRQALDEEGITPDTPVQAKITNARLDNALARILHPHNLTYVVR
ncbi:MAG: STN domain-containing protein, partial [Planctomycetes bacterium]|nr:STN domain-containing protein [Planctomycetota bacterium]